MENNYVQIVGIDKFGQSHTLWKAPEDPDKMPDLITGMFIKIHMLTVEKIMFGFIYKNTIIYQDGTWDETRYIHQESYGTDFECNAELTIYEDGLKFYPSNVDYPVKWSGKVYIA